MVSFFFLFLLLSFSSSPNLSGLRSNVYHTYTHGVASANLECRSETCCTQLAGNTGPKNRQKSPSGHHPTTLSGYVFPNKTRMDNRKKVLSSNISHTCVYNMLNFGLLAAEIVSLVWGTPANLWSPYVIGQTIYIFILFLSSSSSFFFSFLA